MPLGLILLIGFMTVLLVGWLVLTYKEPLTKRRIAADYRHQHSENPQWLPGTGGGQGGI